MSVQLARHSRMNINDTNCTIRQTPIQAPRLISAANVSKSANARPHNRQLRARRQRVLHVVQRNIRVGWLKHHILCHKPPQFRIPVLIQKPIQACCRLFRAFHDKFLGRKQRREFVELLSVPKKRNRLIPILWRQRRNMLFEERVAGRRVTVLDRRHYRVAENRKQDVIQFRRFVVHKFEKVFIHSVKTTPGLPNLVGKRGWRREQVFH